MPHVNMLSSERSNLREPRNGSGSPEFRVGQRVHYSGDSHRTGSVKYIGPVKGYTGTWIGVDWDDGNGKHDGCHNGLRYFEASSSTSASFVRPNNLSAGISLLHAVELRYGTASSKEDEDEMYVFSASNKRVTVQLLGKEEIQNKLSHFEELKSASLSYLGVGYAGDPHHITTTIPNVKELVLTGNLLSEWEDVGVICTTLHALEVLNLSRNIMSHDICGMPMLNAIRVLVLNHTGIGWKHVEILKDSLPMIEELHLVGNKLKEITPSSSAFVQGFKFLHLLNLDCNCIDSWGEILKLSQLESLEQLFLNHNNISCIWYPDNVTMYETLNVDECNTKSSRPFKNLHSLLLGNNNIKDLESVDSLNSFPDLLDVRLSENPVADPEKCGMPRYVLVARLAGVKILNGSEVSIRERKESEIRYVRLVMSKSREFPQKIERLHPRFAELKRYHGIEDEKLQSGSTGPQKMAAGLISITMKCVGASICEKPPLTKKLPATTTIGKLKNLCESFFNLRSIKPKLYLHEVGAPLPTLLDDDTANLNDAGFGNESVVLVDEE
ncbi:unnamed protein product [Cuscuta epithymum]|uniref:CAP-Gly domain-containing protein n=1 Tax=Cuscuta epithymum TaxID=186058 RepID=A0AAV0EFA0_9ASTE|nr:unnamed protein product [Cuscuta epithymum]